MIIGITGTNGAGKGTVVEYLVEHKGFAHYSARDFIMEEVKRRGMPIDRNSTNVVGNDLRKAYGPAYIAEQLLGKALTDGSNAVIESIRSIGEAEFLKSHGAVLWGVDADRKTRFERNVQRGTGTDKVTFEEFVAQEDREMDKTERYNMNIRGVMAMADAVLTNDTTPEDLYAQVDQALHKAGIQ